MDVAQTLSEVRRRAGLTLRQLAAQAGTSHSALAAYESGSKQPSTRTMSRIIEAAGFAVDFELAQRHRGDSHSLPRGEELRQVLVLAEQFPARHESHLTYPVFAESCQ